jgi:hypothetical protein
VPPATKVGNHYSALSLGSFAWSWLVTLALVGLASVGTRFTVEGKIWGARPLQTFLLSPPIDKWEHYANDDYQHAKRDQER